VPLMVQNTSKAGQGEYRLAAADMPSVVLEAVDQRISGQPLDAKAEQEAIHKGWQRQP